MNPRHLPGMLSREELDEAAHRGEIDTVLVLFPDLYGRLLGKRLTVRHFLEHAAAGGTHVCDYLLTCDVEMDPVQGYRFTSWATGYGDLLAVPDLETLRVAAWLDRSAMVFCDLFTEPNHEPAEVSPRRMLRRQLERAREMGFRVMAGTEVELYVFDESYTSAREKGYAGLQPASNYSEDYHLFQSFKEEPLLGAIRRGLDASGVPMEGTKGEWGPGQQEINLEYSEALAQADRSVLCKHAAKEIAYAQGRAVTFMAKWDENVAGSGMHVHLSLRDADGPSSRTEGTEPLGPVQASQEFRWFLGGLLAHTRELSVFLAPNVSSYKRFQAGTFAPVNIAWSHDNRTSGFRMCGSGPSLRVECRIPGADANPYLVYAVLIAAGLDGIRAQTEPSPIAVGDSYQSGELPRVPATLREAIGELERSTFAREALGEAVVEHYLHFFRTEQSKFDAVITDWEKARFFERI